MDTNCIVEDEKKAQYREMIHEVRRELSALHHYWSAGKNGKPCDEFPAGELKVSNIPAVLTALHNFYLEIRGREYRHGTEKRFFRNSWNRCIYDRKIKELKEKYAEVL